MYTRKPVPQLLAAREEIWDDFLRKGPAAAVFVGRPLVFRAHLPPPYPPWPYPARSQEIRRILREDYVRLKGYTRLWVYLRRDRLPRGSP